MVSIPVDLVLDHPYRVTDARNVTQYQRNERPIVRRPKSCAFEFSAWYTNTQIAVVIMVVAADANVSASFRGGSSVVALSWLPPSWSLVVVVVAAAAASTPLRRCMLLLAVRLMRNTRGAIH